MNKPKHVYFNISNAFQHHDKNQQGTYTSQKRNEGMQPSIIENIHEGSIRINEVNFRNQKMNDALLRNKLEDQDHLISPSMKIIRLVIIFHAQNLVTKNRME